MSFPYHDGMQCRQGGRCIHYARNNAPCADEAPGVYVIHHYSPLFTYLFTAVHAPIHVGAVHYEYDTVICGGTLPR
jgi:hypothetical protein